MSQQVSQLTQGSQIKLGSIYGNPIIWTLLEHNHSGYPDGSSTLLTTQIIKLMCVDAMEPNNSDSNRKFYGNNNYEKSNIRQWLNKDVESGWYVAQHDADQAPDASHCYSGYNPYVDAPAFLFPWTDDEKACLVDTTYTVGLATVDGGGTTMLTDKIFFLSGTEVGLSDGFTCGVKFSQFNSNNDRIATVSADAAANSIYSVDANARWYYWLRNPYSSHPSRVPIVNSSGVLGNYFAFRGDSGCRPACNISSTTLVSDTVDSDGCYTLVSSPTPPGPEPTSPSVQIQMQNPVEFLSGSPLAVHVILDQYTPEGAEILIEVCNNAFDEEPTWEDATQEILAGEDYEFTNTTKETSKSWGVNVRITQTDATNECYIKGFAGVFR